MGNGDQLLPIHPQADEWGMNNILVKYPCLFYPFILYSSSIHPPFIHEIGKTVPLDTLLEMNGDEWRMNNILALSIHPPFIHLKDEWVKFIPIHPHSPFICYVLQNEFVMES